MARYGNIMTVVNPDAQTQVTVEQLLSANGTDFLLFNGMYYIETTSKVNTADVIRALKDQGIGFVLFHNHISDNSEVKFNNVNDDIINEIKRLLLE